MAHSADASLAWSVRAWCPEPPAESSFITAEPWAHYVGNAGKSQGDEDHRPDADKETQDERLARERFSTTTTHSAPHHQKATTFRRRFAVDCQLLISTQQPGSQR